MHGVIYEYTHHRPTLPLASHHYDHTLGTEGEEGGRDGRGGERAIGLEGVLMGHVEGPWSMAEAKSNSKHSQGTLIEMYIPK